MGRNQIFKADTKKEPPLWCDSVCSFSNGSEHYSVIWKGSDDHRRRVSPVVEHSSANPKVPGSIPAWSRLGSWIMMRHVKCILLLEWSTTSQRLWVYRISVPYTQKDPRLLFEKRRGQPREFWSLISTIDGSTLPQDCVEEQLC